MKSLVICFAVAGLLSAAICQKLPTVEEALAKVNEVIPKAIEIPGLSNFDLKNINISALPIDDAQNVLKKKCEKYGGPGAYDVAKKAGIEAYDCVKGLVNMTVLLEEMEIAKPTGDLDEVFKKYCRKKPILKRCMETFTTAIEPCLEPQEKENKKIVHNITEKILNFICFKEGDRIALFIAAKGPQCFTNKSESIKQCANTVYGENSNNLAFNPAMGLTGLSEIKTIPSLIFDEKVCRNMQKLQTCVVKTLEGCDDPTPSNLLDSIFNYIRKVTPCEKMLSDMPQAQAQTMENSATTRNIGVIAVVIAALVVVMS